MDMAEFFSHMEEGIAARSRQAGFVAHAGDRGENREEVLRDFLSGHLPKRYGVVKGEVVTKEGLHSHAADVIIYDSVNCPVLYSGQTAVVPIEGVYGVIEVKSRLSKQELQDAASKIESFKRLAPRDLSVIQTREYVTLHRPSRPFGMILAYELADNSLESLTANLEEEHRRIHDVNYFINLVCVLGAGVLYIEQANVSLGEKHIMLGTDELVDLIVLNEKRRRNQEEFDEIYLRVVPKELGPLSFGRFFVYLLLTLSRIKLGIPDLGRYLDPEAPMLIHRES
jgi:hypothetical protein